MNPKKMVRKLVPKAAVKLLERSYRYSRGAALYQKNGRPGKRANIIAVTGTNGKTSTCTIINEILRSAGKKTAVFTTVYTEFDGVRTDNLTHVTTGLTDQILSNIKKAEDQDIEWIIIEITSHALHQFKMWGIKPTIAIITNLTQDHLDYHKTMPAYAKAKSRLFSYHKPELAILNRDDKWFATFAEVCSPKTKIVSYGQDKTSYYRIDNPHTDSSGSDFHLVLEGTTMDLATPLVGMFNIYNSSAAVIACLRAGLSFEEVAKGLSKVKLVPGRMQKVDAGQDFTVVVDYAHTDDALANVLQAARSMISKSNKVRVVFGATGDRDKTKRSAMGKVAAKNADVIYLTDDETYSEDGLTIQQEVFAGIKQAKGESKTTLFPDRIEAIKKAFKDAKPGDIIVLAGLGHQDHRVMSGEKVLYHEPTVALELLKKLRK
jgi:UDP-N-acetylmuramoyl-L-alanyl-D-glutamate--2,6-diaminopimelate ligase